MRPQVSPTCLIVTFVLVLVCTSAVSAQSIPCDLTQVRACVHLRNDSQLLPATPPPTRRLPVLFVHGHNAEDPQDADFNYQKNWQDETRVSFKPTLEHIDNAGLDIEDYYIRFAEQGRSISEDATDISDAIDLILHRHDPNYAYPHVPGQTSHIKVVIIAYSKGTLSSRLYLKSLQTNLVGMPPARPGFNPVSEFIALAPPNHGIATGLGTTCAGQQMMNGRSALTCREFGQPLTPNPEPCGPLPAGGLNFITDLNTPDEAPGSRPATNNLNAPTAPTLGILYVTIFANAQNPDFVGSDVDPMTCQSRPLATNRSTNAVNIPLAIAGASEGEVHQNTPHTPLVICKALYAAVHHRSPVNEDCSLVAGASDPPVIPAPTRAAAILSLDFSGSMAAPACPTCPTRAVLLEDAVELFIQLWSAVGVPSDRLGVNYFRTDVDDTFNVGGESLPLLTDGKDLIIDSVGNQGPGYLTAMGGGIKRAVEVVGGFSNTSIRRVILFTDGMQNVNPMVLNQNSQLVIVDDGTGRQDSNVPGTPPLVLDRSSGIAIDTIGIGASAQFVGLLQDIAGATGGRTWPTSDPAYDLRRFFVEELINALKGFSPQLVAYRRGSVGSRGSTEAFVIESGVRKLVFKVSAKRGETFDFSVARNGVDVTSHGRFINGSFYKIFVLDFPAKGGINSRGNWQVRIKGKTATAYEAAAIVDGGDIRYDALFNAARPRVGDPLELLVQVTSAGKPLARNARVTMTLMRPKVEISRVIDKIRPNELTAFEPGLSVAEQKQLALFQRPARWRELQRKQERVVMKMNEKGEFRARIRPLLPGIYAARITIDGDIEKLGRFSRTVTAVTVVRSKK